MAEPVPLPPPDFDALSVDEQIDYVRSLWDRTAASPETMPVPDWHRDVLRVRLTDLQDDPDARESLELVQERLRKELHDRH